MQQTLRLLLPRGDAGLFLAHQTEDVNWTPQRQPTLREVDRVI